ncbi:flotillin family inner membrane protein YqiK [Candidatus Magnetomoraceae bacterium gMMP-15]
MGNMMFIIMTAVIIIVSLIVIGTILSRLYRRSTKEQAFVRTGFRGQKVIMDGGAIILPILHETILVNMNTLRLVVNRSEDQALITKDRMRVDVEAEFYVRVKPTKEAIANAAQTLGTKTMRPDELKELVEGKFVDSLRSVAAEMEMEELHEKRTDFVQKVQQTVAEDLAKNGLELESVSLTGLDQTDEKYFNAQNAFDAAGLTKLTKQIESKRQERNAIKQETEIAIQQKDLETEKQTLTIQKDEETAKLAQQREIEARKAQQLSEITKYKADKERESKQAEITAKQQIDQSEIDSKQTIEERQIKMEQALKQKEIERDKILKTSSIEQEKEIAKSRVEKEKDIEIANQDKEVAIVNKSKEKSLAEIIKEQEIDRAQLEKEKIIELANQEKEVAIVNKSKEKSIAEKNAAIARAQAVKEKELVQTVKEKEIAERQRAIQLIEANKIAEQKAIQIKVAAEAEKQAAIDKADATRTIAEADKDAELLKIETTQKRYEVEAEGKEKIIQAENKLSPVMIDMKIKQEVIKQLPIIIQESVKPLEKIDSIKIFQLDGMKDMTGCDGEVKADGNFADQVVTGALKYRTQSALVDQLLSTIGGKGGDLSELAKPLMENLSKKKQQTVNDEPVIDLVESVSIKETSNKTPPYAALKLHGEKTMAFCPKCNTKYNVTEILGNPDVDIDPDTPGQQIRCKKCKTIFSLPEEK